MKDKIPFYNIVNMFFVGAVFSIALVLMLIEKIHIDPKYMKIALDWNILVSAFLIIDMYEVGFIINRMSSIIVETILVKTNIWPRNSYDIDVSEISANNSKFQSMITELNLMRSHIFIYVVLAMLSIALKRYWLTPLFVILVVVFTCGGRKHNAKINKIRQSYYERYNRNET